MAAVFPLTPGKELAGRFRVIRFIAAGGMGDVFEVEDLELHEHVALKTIRAGVVRDPRMLARFKREIQYAKRVTHPNVCRIYDLGWHRDGESEILFLTMELLQGETLAEYLRSHGRMPRQEALPVIAQMAEALSAAHRAGVIHRDFKTSNVMLVGCGQARKAVVTDFGLARASSAVDDDSVTEPGKVVGTPAYMAPEQFTAGEVTPATDVYAFGLVMYEMVTGRRPFHCAPPIAAARKRATEPPPSPAADVPGLDPLWESAILRCLEREPARRFQDPREVVAALTTRLAERSTVTLTGQRTRLFSPRRLASLLSRRAVLAGALLTAALAIAGLLFQNSAWRRAAEPPLKSIAVLPFENSGGDPQMEYYSDGFTEELINSLAGISELRVIARESSLRLKRTTLTSEEIGKRLRVRVLVMGSIRRTSGRLRVTARLVKAEDGLQLWSDSYDGDEKDLPDIQDRLAGAIESAMEVRLAASQIGSQRGPLPNLPAQDLYWMGRYHWRSRTEDGLRRAIDYFERAIEKDPGYAAAFSGLADVYSVLAEWNTVPPAEALSRARSAARKAVSLNGNLADAHVSLAHVTSLYDRDFGAAERHFQEALRLNPNLVTAHQWYSYMLLKQRRFDESMRHARRALDLDPVWEVSVSAKQHHLERKKPMPYVNHYSFHILDPDWGHVTIKISGHPPFPAQIIFNGHEYVAFQARKAGIGFTKEGNCFTHVADVTGLAKIADTLGHR